MPYPQSVSSRTRLTRILMAIVCLLSLSGTLSATTIRVPIDQPTIQAAIDAAVNGDSVRVSPGTYSGDGNRDIDFKGKSIVVLAFFGPEGTLINCEGSETEPHVGFILHSGEPASTQLVGFRIENAWAGTSYGGAITCINSSPYINNCLIFNNHATGILIEGNSHPDISYCRMNRNTGSGLEIGNAVSFLSGGLISFSSFWHNALDGILILNCDSLNILNCSSVKNGRYGFNLLGDMPKDLDKAAPSTILAGSIAAFNTSGGILCQPGFSGLSMNCNDAYGNLQFNYQGVDSFLTSTYNNFSADPLFCSVGLGDLGLLFDSPCVYNNSPCAALIGARGGFCTVVCGDVNNSWAVTISDVVYLINYIFAGGQPPTSLWHGDANCNGVINVSDVVYEIAYIFAGGPAPCDNCP
jgi:hypothetical protein